MADGHLGRRQPGGWRQSLVPTWLLVIEYSKTVCYHGMGAIAGVIVGVDIRHVHSTMDRNPEIPGSERERRMEDEQLHLPKIVMDYGTPLVIDPGGGEEQRLGREVGEDLELAILLEEKDETLTRSSAGSSRIGPSSPEEQLIPSVAASTEIAK